MEIPSDARVDNLRSSPVDNRLAFVTRAVYRAGVDESERETYDSRLFSYDIDGEQLQPVDTLSDTGNVENVLYSRDGQALLYRTLDGVFYLTGAARTTEPVVVGIYQESGGFNRTGAKLAFRGSGGADIYDAQAKESQELTGIGAGGRISAPAFLHNSDDIVYLWDPYNAKEGEATWIYIASADGEEQVVSSRPSERFFDVPVVSHDDRYVLVEVTSEDSDLDDYSASRQPEDARLMLYDRYEREEIGADTRGIDPVWDR